MKLSNKPKPSKIEVPFENESKNIKSSKNRPQKPKKAAKNKQKQQPDKVPKKDHKPKEDVIPTYETLSLLEKLVLKSTHAFQGKHYSGTVNFRDIIDHLLHLEKSEEEIRQAVESCAQNMLLVEDKRRPDYFILSRLANRLVNQNLDKDKIDLPVMVGNKRTMRRIQKLKIMNSMTENIQITSNNIERSEELIKEGGEGYNANQMELLNELKDRTEKLRDRIEQFKANNNEALKNDQTTHGSSESLPKPTDSIQVSAKMDANIGINKKREVVEHGFHPKMEAEIALEMESVTVPKVERKKKRKNSEPQAKLPKADQASLAKTAKESKAERKKRKAPVGVDAMVKKIKKEPINF